MSREPDHAASGLHQEQKDSEGRAILHSGLERSGKALMKEISREPDHAASGLHQEQKDLKVEPCPVAVWSEATKTTDPLGRATGPF